MKISDLVVKFSDKTIFDGFDVDFQKGSITAILGDSGVGKTTLLNCIAGLVDFEGKVEDFGVVSYTFQEPRLIPSATVMQNLLYVTGGKTEESKAQIRQLLDVVGMTCEEDTLVTKLSGGMQSRVSLVRAFLYESDVLLMDEPFKSLDLGLAIRLTQDLTKLLQKNPRSVILVTHDVDEAVRLADRIIVLSGRPAKIVFDEINDSEGIKERLVKTLIG